MSSTVPAQHPAVVLRSTYLQLRALLAIAAIALVGLTVAVVVLAMNTPASTTSGTAARVNSSAIAANASEDLGAKLDHRGLTSRTPQPANNRSYFYAGHY